MDKVLTIAVPAYNMEKYLPHNLPFYADKRFGDRIEVILLDNASTDRTREIAQQFCDRWPQIFVLEQRNSRGYGSSVNAALARARGRYFRIIDGDDWADTDQLLALVERLETCEADVVQTNYRRVVMGSGKELPFRFSNVEYGKLYTEFSPCRENAPCIHSTAYRTAMLLESGFQMQDGIFFVDEEYVILPFLSARSVIYYDLDIYRYLVGNPAQSTSPENRAKYAGHREQVVRRLIDVYTKAQMTGDARAYCFFRIAQAAADHLTTLCIYQPDRAAGYRQAVDWERYVRERSPELFCAIRKKGFLLRLLNRMGVGLENYQRLKRILLRKN